MLSFKIDIIEVGARRAVETIHFGSDSIEDALNRQSDHWNDHLALSQRHSSRLYAKSASSRWERLGMIFC